jgi:hypothetical protein
LEIANWDDSLEETDMEIPAAMVRAPIPNDLMETLSARDVLDYERDPVEYQFTNDMMLAVSRWIVRNQRRPTVVISPNFFAGYYNYWGNPRTELDMAQDQQAVLAAPAAANAVFFNRFTQWPELSDIADGAQMLFRENFAPHQPLEDAELIIFPVMLHHHFAMAIWDRFGDVAIHYYDSLGWGLQDGTRVQNGIRQPHPLVPNIEQDLLHIVSTIMGDRTPVNLRVHEHKLRAKEHNQQDDGDQQFNCGLYGLLNLEAYIFQGGNCYIQDLDIGRERRRILQMLKDLLQPILPSEYVPPNFEGDSDLFVVQQSYSDQTVVRQGQGGSVTYARPSPADGGNHFPKTTSRGTKVIDNRYVVPHNRVLTMLFGCHICVEFITAYSIWFYLFKYQNKPNHLSVMTALYVRDETDPNVYHADEFNVRREMAFYGSFEAVDILRSEPWSGRSHDPLFLSVHLEGEEPIFYMAGHAEAAETRAANPEYRSKFMAYMKLCSED